MPLYGGLPLASNLNSLLESDSFLWATGIEDTFITSSNIRTGRMLDEYELTGHYLRWREDFELMVTLGISCARYGIPWYRVQHAPNRWDWSWPDQTFEQMLKSGIEPIVDLVHYGVPDWLQHGLLDQDFPSRMAEYGAAVAERYKGRVRWYTPLNEPRINAWYAGMLGWWPPKKRGWKGFVSVLLNICRAVCLTHRALKEVDEDIVCVHVDPADRYFTANVTLQEETKMRQQLVFLALDLVSGKVDEAHPLWPWLIKLVEPQELERFLAIAVQPDVVGINCYPLFGNKEVLKSGKRVLTRNRYGSGELLDSLTTIYWERYHRPMIITETASSGKKRQEWMEQSLASVRRMRESGVPVIGYTWWPMFSLVGWAYQRGRRPKEDYFVHMGLWDLDSNLNRIETTFAQSYRKFVELGSGAIGELQMDRTRFPDVALR